MCGYRYSAGYLILRSLILQKEASPRRYNTNVSTYQRTLKRKRMSWLEASKTAQLFMSRRGPEDDCYVAIRWPPTGCSSTLADEWLYKAIN